MGCKEEMTMTYSGIVVSGGKKKNRTDKIKTTGIPVVLFYAKYYLPKSIFFSLA